MVQSSKCHLVVLTKLLLVTERFEELTAPDSNGNDLLDLSGSYNVTSKVPPFVCLIWMMLQLSQSGLCTEASDCVTYNSGNNKIIFGSSTKLHVNDSKLDSFHSLVGILL